ncbi:porin [Rhodalgimonas zhirmunskyi]|uniref:Porin domain-containing protein n=1 Tax=Rhodalgimonas zhirmunskyi TaxID=2964767 RepID=A0AAJ1UA79_9RHOB|nr:porin [Rhodoalgimonas zhirmunskyi]MDQ2094083.1 hypothetical protein [Rhodoalgimonas zhirmunskyi]
MKNYLLGAGLTTAALCFAGAARAQDSRLSYEIEVEIGVDSVISSDIAGNEMTDTYATANVTLGYNLAPGVDAFLALTHESVLDPTGDRTFEDMGMYVGELGLSFAVGPAEVRVGKIGVPFGIAWDVTPGYYGTALAEDYELSEMIGVSAAVELAQGTLTASVFYMDDTGLSRSWGGTDRGRNTVAAGGAGNTGKLNNVALQYDVEFGATSLHAGASYLTRGQGDVADQKGLALGVVHGINDDLELMGEVAHFSGYGGTSDKATYATLGLAYTRGPITYSASLAQRDVTSTGKDRIATLGVDYEFKNGITLTSGYAFIDEAGANSQALGMAVVIPIGG